MSALQMDVSPKPFVWPFGPPSDSFLRMDPDTGSIDVLVPIEWKPEQVFSESDGAWRVVSAAEAAYYWEMPISFVAPEQFEEASEFDREFEAVLIRATQRQVQ